MIITANATCDLLTVVSENGYIDDIVTADGNSCCHVLELGNNCCDPTLLLPIRSLYNLDYGVLGCGAATVEGIPGFFFDISILGLNFNCFESITYPDTNNIGTVTDTNPISAAFRFEFNQLPVGNIMPFQVSITTCTGLTYILDFTITIGDPADPCGTAVLDPVAVTYPPLPTGVTINVSNEFEITPLALGFTSPTFPDGIFFAGLSQTDILGDVVAESNSLFVNCETTCRVIDVLANNTCSNIYLLFDALRYADNCTTISYQQKCDMWYVIGKELGYFINTPCEETTDCGCNK